MYKTPGVYIEEISKFPPSVAEVSTAIPAFIGCTEKGPDFARITTMLDFERTFGGAKPTAFKVQTSKDEESGLPIVDQVDASDVTKGQPEFLLYYCMQHFFMNGGAACYVISAGDYSAAPKKEGFEKALSLLEKEDEPTLIVLTDAVKLAPADYHALCQQSLGQCRKLQDRFAIFDVKDGDTKAFRDGVGTNGLMYGAAYYPYLRTSLNFHYRESDVQVLSADDDAVASWARDFGGNTIVVRFSGTADTPPKVRLIGGTASDPLDFEVAAGQLTARNVNEKTGTETVAAWAAWIAAATNDAGGFTVEVSGDGSGIVQLSSSVELEKQGTNSLDNLKDDQTALYNLVKEYLTRERVVLPPSATMAGIYAQVDRQRGVWKAPANVSLSAVIEPVSKTTDEAQAALNVDPTAGKSINAIRSFTGKGMLVWGARTLAGNDNEWRYVPVRRLFILIEESIQKSTAFAVFEPNDATTWLKVKGMIESYLYGLWERGALAGSTSEAAYYVSVGLGKTMTPQDILEGRMIVEVGVAAVRPAEFIILRFSHKLQTA